MFYTIYKITNKRNNKFYIGMHKTTNLNDGYMGSGKLIKRAIKKYGIENFNKEILFIFDNEEDMKLKEKELVVLNEMSYNLLEGGTGGFGFLNKNKLNNLNKDKKEIYQKVSNSLKGRKNKEASERLKIRHQEGLVNYNTFSGKHHTEETKLKISKAHIGKTPWNKGVPRSEETKEKIRQTLLKNKSNISVV